MNLEKSQFHQEEVSFLDYIVDKNNIRINPKKVKAVKDWPDPFYKTLLTYKNSQDFVTTIDGLSKDIQASPYLFTI